MTSLQTLQQAAVDLCYGAEPLPAQFALLGDERIFRIYREAVRKRLLGELKVALPRTAALLGAERFEALFARYLQSAPPRTRFFHAVVDAFAQQAIGWLHAEEAALAHAGDLCAYEAARWTVSDLSDAAGDVQAFAFDRVPVLTPALRLLHLTHSVHLGSDPIERGEYRLCVYRKREDAHARYFSLNPTTDALLRRFVTGEETATDSVAHVAQQRGLLVDEPFLDGLCTVLADFLEQGLLLGSR